MKSTLRSHNGTRFDESRAFPGERFSGALIADVYDIRPISLSQRVVRLTIRILEYDLGGKPDRVSVLRLNANYPAMPVKNNRRFQNRERWDLDAQHDLCVWNWDWIGQNE
jgi:hypothetical protein